MRLTAIGGPAASVVMMRQEFVVRHQWLTEEEFLDYWALSNLVPGPNATELAIHIGYKIAGWPGLIAAGVVCAAARAAAARSAVGGRDTFQPGPPVLGVPQGRRADVRQRICAVGLCPG